ncbi:FlgD immunoglobulin-like domain containing protein, partial [Klebsiella pneumoniae]|uniref:FlgD immunoglobulin-like domain containing protein n=1 Tax=Klebsiella pneumoniae TaxID=573 RepID=UPI003AF74FB4
TTFPLTSSSESIDVKMHLPKESKDGATFQILNSSGNVVREIKVEKDDLKVGTNTIKWDGRDNDGNYVGAGNYTMKVNYTDIDGGTSSSTYGAYPIESIQFRDGVPYAQLAGQYVTFDNIS